MSPPNPMGPIPLLLMAWSNSLSSAAISESELGVPIGLNIASLASFTHSSAVPPIPTPTTVGGHPWPPASRMLSRTNLLIPFKPSEGSNIVIHVIFSILLINPLFTKNREIEND